MLCPMPIYRVSMALAKMQRGEVLVVTATDRGALRDFPALARQAGHDLLDTSETGPSTWVFRFRKGGR